jgi:hypothetical protein
MSKTLPRRVNRRRFLQLSALATAGAAVMPRLRLPLRNRERLTVVVDPNDAVASSARWALTHLQELLEHNGVSSSVVPQLSDTPSGSRCLLVSSSAGEAAQKILNEKKVSVAAAAESLAIAEGELNNRSVLLACGNDTAGLTYALLELADRVQCSDSPLSVLEQSTPITEQPANSVRSIYRAFTSEIEDKPWFYDRVAWKEYLTLITSQRFNRLNLAFGMGYNTASRVTDSYFLFPFPFLLSVLGYNVKMGNLPDAERDKNLDTLKFISEETAAHGIDFQVGLWSLGREWPDSPDVNYPLLGLTKENHAPYCRDALVMLLKECPAISGITFRVHGESGVPDGDYSFWETTFEAFAKCGRKVRIDLHSKNCPQRMIDIAVATGMPVTISPKYWGEHTGAGYVPASIRKHEMPTEPYVEQPTGVSLGSRVFTRYSYGDYFKEDRPYGIIHRIWPGTQHFLLGSDPVLTGAYGRASSFCGGLGYEIPDPLTFKGRQGSGHVGGRCAYSEKSLEPKYDWQKYLFAYRMWGRLAFNPDCNSDVWRRALRTDFSNAADAVEKSLANAGRILALVTTYHVPSADCTRYWPEVYTDISIVTPIKDPFYWDAEHPLVFGNVTSLDPQLFFRIDEYADALLAGKTLQKYNPIEVAEKLEQLAAAASKSIAEAQTAISNNIQFRRIVIDVTIQANLGKFFASKTRAAMLWRICEQTGEAEALKEAVAEYRLARDAWKEISEGVGRNYTADVSYGERANLRGDWSDRLAAIEDDLTAMEKKLAEPRAASKGDPELIRHAIHIALSHPRRTTVSCNHAHPQTFEKGKALPIEIAAPSGTRSTNLYYRHVNQALVWEMLPMTTNGNLYRASIPSEYTRTNFPLQYYFVLDTEAGITIYPGLDEDFMNQPYYVVRGRKDSK